MDRKPKIACAGDLLVEFVAGGKNGRHLRVETYTGPFPSGAAGIFIDQAAQVGGDCLFVGGLGEDAFGDVVLDRLRAHGVDTGLIKRVPGVPTGTAFVSYNDDGSRDFVYNIPLSAAARFEADAHTIAALIAFGPDVLHVSGSALGDSGMAGKIVKICEAAHAAGVKISFDPNVRKELAGDPAYFGAVAKVLAMSAIFLPSEIDAETLFPGRAPADFAAELFARGAEAVILKKGEHGCEGLTRSGERAAFAAHNVEAVDPTGAGDCFCATFVTLYAGGMGLADAMERANAAGALAVGKVGPMEGNSSLAMIEAMMARRA